MNGKSDRLMRGSAIALTVLYAVVFLPATLGAFAGFMWIGVSDRGWQTQYAAGAFIVGWLAVLAGALSAWQAIRVRSEVGMFFGVICIPITIVCYVIVYAWGGRMLT
jgi:hypothetical protein